MRFKSGKKVGRYTLAAISALVIFSSLSAVGCSSVIASESCQPSEIQRHRSMWTAGNHLNYDYHLEKKAGGMYPFAPVEVSVLDGKANGFKKTTDEYPLQRVDGLEQYGSIDLLFELIESKCKEGVAIEVSYDPNLGFPTNIVVTSPKIHGGYGLEVTNLKFRD